MTTTIDITQAEAVAEKRQRAATKEHRQDEVLAVLWNMGWLLTGGTGRLWLARDNSTAASHLGMVEGHLRAVILQLEEAGRAEKLQRGLWLIRKKDVKSAGRT